MISFETRVTAPDCRVDAPMPTRYSLHVLVSLQVWCFAACRSRCSSYDTCRCDRADCCRLRFATSRGRRQAHKQTNKPRNPSTSSLIIIHHHAQTLICHQSRRRRSVGLLLAGGLFVTRALCAAPLRCFCMVCAAKQCMHICGSQVCASLCVACIALVDWPLRCGAPYAKPPAA